MRKVAFIFKISYADWLNNKTDRCWPHPVDSDIHAKTESSIKSTYYNMRLGWRGRASLLDGDVHRGACFNLLKQQDFSCRSSTTVRAAMADPAATDPSACCRIDHWINTRTVHGAGAMLFLLALLVAATGNAQERAIPRASLKTGIEFASTEVRALQADDFANPGMLWVARGEKLWSAPAGSSGKACAACHHDARASMKGVATRYPKVDPGAARLVNLETRINLCRERRASALR